METSHNNLQAINYDYRRQATKTNEFELRPVYSVWIYTAVLRKVCE